MEDSLGDRMKKYEAAETSRMINPDLPLIARMDGRGFSKWTKGLPRPFDQAFSDAMEETTLKLVRETGAHIGYTQSDEITLVIHSGKDQSDLMFRGKIQKLCSVLASLTTSAFLISCINKKGSEISRRVDRLPHFDARIFQVPSETEAANAVLWRALDASKNAISMAARSVIPHRALQGKNSNQMIQMLKDKGIDFDQYPAGFRLGTFIQTVEKQMVLSAEIKAKYHSERESDLILRNFVEKIEMPRFLDVANREDVIFRRAKPIIANASY